MSAYSDHERALYMILHVLGPKGRATLRAHLLTQCDRDDHHTSEAHVTLNVMNEVERGFDAVEREREKPT